MKLFKTLVLGFLTLVCIGIIITFETNSWPAGSSIAGIVIGISLPALFHSIQDLSDTTDWKVSQRKLKRGGFIKDDTIVRISFAYLFRIKVGNSYLLVKNDRGTGKYQPVGGVYKIRGNEKIELKNRYHVIDDDKIAIDESSRDDYRLRMENRYLRRFVRRFIKKADRENITDLSREFKEELIEKGILNWKQISYRYCGRHLTELKFGYHFQIYELLLADIVELIPTEAQEKNLQELMEQNSDLYCFATADSIMSLGIDTSAGKLVESIADHSQKVIQENEGHLITTRDVGKIYTVQLN